MVTNRNPVFHACQPRVTARIGNILFLNPAMQLVSQPLQPIFSIVKADEIRRRADLSYAAIAERMGLKARQTVGHWFRGRGEPDMRQLKAMANAMGCHWLDLVDEEATVVYDRAEIARIARLRSLTPEAMAKLDAFLEIESKGGSA